MNIKSRQLSLQLKHCIVVMATHGMESRIYNQCLHDKTQSANHCCVRSNEP